MDLLVPTLTIVIFSGLGFLLLQSGIKDWKRLRGCSSEILTPIRLLVAYIQIGVGLFGMLFAVAQIIAFCRAIF